MMTPTDIIDSTVRKNSAPPTESSPVASPSLTTLVNHLIEMDKKLGWPGRRAASEVEAPPVREVETARVDFEKDELLHALHALALLLNYSSDPDDVSNPCSARSVEPLLEELGKYAEAHPTHDEEQDPAEFLSALHNVATSIVSLLEASPNVTSGSNATLKNTSVGTRTWQSNTNSTVWTGDVEDGNFLNDFLRSSTLPSSAVSRRRSEILSASDAALWEAVHCGQSLPGCDSIGRRFHAASISVLPPSPVFSSQTGLRSLESQHRDDVCFLKLLVSDALATSFSSDLPGFPSLSEFLAERDDSFVTLSPEGILFPGTRDRILSIGSQSPLGILTVVNFVIDRILFVAHHDSTGQNKPRCKIAVPRTVIGSVIGKNGAYVQFVRMSTGAHVHVSPLFVRADEACSERLITISSRDKSGLRAAVFTIVTKINVHTERASCRNATYWKRSRIPCPPPPLLALGKTSPPPPPPPPEVCSLLCEGAESPQLPDDFKRYSGDSTTSSEMPMQHRAPHLPTYPRERISTGSTTATRKNTSLCIPFLPDSENRFCKKPAEEFADQRWMVEKGISSLFIEEDSSFSMCHFSMN